MYLRNSLLIELRSSGFIVYEKDTPTEVDFNLTSLGQLAWNVLFVIHLVNLCTVGNVYLALTSMYRVVSVGLVCPSIHWIN